VEETSSEEGSTDPSQVIQPPLRFSGVIASAGRVYAACLRRTFGPFALAALFLFLTPVLLALDIADNLLLPLAFLLIVVLPTFLFSLMFALASVQFHHFLDGESIGFRDAMRELQPRRKDVVVSGLFAGMASLAVSVFLLPLWPLLAVLFIGPPILIHTIALEDLDLPEGWARTRALMTGHWLRMIGYLVCISMGIGLLTTTAGGLAAQLLDDANRWVALAILFPFQIVVVALLYPYAAAAGYVCYYDVAARSAGEIEGPEVV
jgi:hypothetical protein